MSAQYGLKKTGSVLLFMLQKKAWLSLYSLLFAVLLFSLLSRYEAWSGFQNGISCLTLAIAFLIWIGEMAQDWESSLPKRLDVSFLHKGSQSGNICEVMSCRGAYLAGQSDIRAWAQQLGKQMTGTNENLSFFPNLEQKGPEIKWDKDQKAFYVQYTISVQLSSLPKSLSNSPLQAPYVSWARENNFWDSRYPPEGEAKA